MENASMPQTFLHQDLITIISEFRTLPDAGMSVDAHKVQFPNGTLLGAGAYGEVYKGRLTNGKQVAVKVLNENGVTEKNFIAEVRIMFTATHKNIVKLYGFCFNDDIKALVYELMAESLDMILFEKEETNLPRIEWEKLYNITIGIAEGLCYLHDGCGIIHHDVKPENVLLDFNGSPKLTGFGVACLMDKNSSHRTGTAIRGTPGYMAPEVVAPSERITYACDVYSYGRMLFEVLARKKNSENQTEDKGFPEQVWDKYEVGHLDEMIVSCGIKGDDIEKARILSMVGFWCIQFKPEARPKVRTIIGWLEKVTPVPKPYNPFFVVGTTTPSPPTPDERDSLENVTPVPEPSNPLLAEAQATTSIQPTPDERMYMRWWWPLGKMVATVFSKFQPQKLPSLKDYMENLFKGSADTIYHQLRMEKHVFIRLCELFRKKRWLRDTEFTIQEKIVIFLLKTNPRFSCNFQCSNVKIYQCFYEVLAAMLKFSSEMIVSPDYDAPVGEIRHCRRLREGPFKGAVGALDGMVIRDMVPKEKNWPNWHNVLGVCDFDMTFVYVIAGLSGIAHDSRKLEEEFQLQKYNFPMPPRGKYYLCDSVRTHTTGFMCPYPRLQDSSCGDPIITKQKAFNQAHVQLSSVIQRAFSALKARFPILYEMMYYPIGTQKNLVLACIAIHNFVRQISREDGIFEEWDTDDLLTNNNGGLDAQKINKSPGKERSDMVILRKQITEQLTKDTSYS